MDEGQQQADIKVFAVSGGDPTQFWAQGRMKGFQDTITKAIPDAKFVTTAKNGLNTSATSRARPTTSIAPS